MVKVSEATGPALDWLVAKCEGYLEPTRELRGKMIPRVVLDPEWYGYDNKLMLRFNPAPDVYYRPEYDPSSNWEVGGPIIEREGISVLAPIVRRIAAERHAFPVECWRAMICRDENEPAIHGRGPTPLIAAMRCYVVSKLGEKVEVPQELM